MLNWDNKFAVSKKAEKSILDIYQQNLVDYDVEEEDDLKAVVTDFSKYSVCLEVEYSSAGTEKSYYYIDRENGNVDC